MSDSIFSIDVEDWFNLSGTGAEPPPSEWDRLESRLRRNFHGLLELLAEGTAKARAGAIEEFPITAVRVFGKPMCFFGGGYLRLFPYSVIRAMGRRALGEGRPVIFYVHPREIDPAQPRMALSRRRRFTCYVNLESTRPKIRRILRDFRVTSFERYMSQRTVQ